MSTHSWLNICCMIFIRHYCKYLLSLDRAAFWNVWITSDVETTKTLKHFVFQWVEKLLCYKTTPWFVGTAHTHTHYCFYHCLLNKNFVSRLTFCRIRQDWNTKNFQTGLVEVLVICTHRIVLLLILFSMWETFASLQHTWNSLIKEYICFY